MKLLVISDTHGYIEAARRAMTELTPWDQVVHLGDSMLDAVELAAELNVDVMGVRGNNEYPGSPAYDDVLVFEMAGARVYAVHGHDPDLNPWSGDFEDRLRELVRRARVAGASLVLFGHTHVPLVRDHDGMLLVNPGGLGAGDQTKTCAVITLEPGQPPAATIETINV